MSPWGVEAPVQTEDDFFNAARRTAFLLVEGTSDERFWLARVRRRQCQVRALGGRESALATLREACAEGKVSFVAVLDADFDRLEECLIEEPGVVWTDHHDLETMLIDSPALDKVLAEAASQAKRERLEQERGCHVRDALRDMAMVLGKLRWLSRRDGLGLSFRKAKPDGTFRFVDYGKCCHRQTWTLADAQVIVQTVLHFSQRQELDAGTLAERMIQLRTDDWRQLCVGHDLVGLLCIGLRARLGHRNLSQDEVQERLRLAFERQDLERTALYRALRAWEREARCTVLP